MPVRFPLFPLNTAMVPGMSMPLHIFEPRYRALIRELQAIADPSERRFGLIAVRDGHLVEQSGPAALYAAGVVVTLEHSEQLDDGRFDIVVHGECRFAPVSIDCSEPLTRAAIEVIPDPPVQVESSLAAGVARELASYATRLGLGTGDQAAIARDIHDDATAASYGITAMVIVPTAERQRLLEAPDAHVRLKRARELLLRENGLISVLGAIPAVDPILTHPSAN